ncbi:hypothetical protein HPB47_017636 [Ixodes persulcatus]|uniref:Uncharacterized protein n=1 Tax=Ixodes persulcatus TaxID=34615 RepID=A0AC60QRD6_IXOPE|nr:hypothetical protein HPB47_017636 [Ixodes persulcatus]
MQDLFLQDKHFKYLFLSRFTQDALENLFSTIRAQNPMPRARDFKMALRLIAMSQFFRPSRSGSYDVDDSAVENRNKVAEGSILNSPSGARETSKGRWYNRWPEEPAEAPSEEEDETPNWDQYKTISDDEPQLLFYLAGYTVRAVKKKHKLCKLCLAAVTGSAASQNARLCQLKCYVRDGSNQELAMPSPDVFGLLLVAEGEFRKHEDLIIASKKTLDDVHQSTAALTKQLPLPKCHNLAQKLVEAFVLLRLRVTLKQKNK